jgi:hypothetical protein
MISNDPDVDTESLNKQRSWGLLRSVCIKWCMGSCLLYMNLG